MSYKKEEKKLALLRSYTYELDDLVRIKLNLLGVSAPQQTERQDQIINKVQLLIKETLYGN